MVNIHLIAKPTQLSSCREYSTVLTASQKVCRCAKTLPFSNDCCGTVRSGRERGRTHPRAGTPPSALERLARAGLAHSATAGAAQRRWLCAAPYPEGISALGDAVCAEDAQLALGSRHDGRLPFAHAAQVTQRRIMLALRGRHERAVRRAKAPEPNLWPQREAREGESESVAGSAAAMGRANGHSGRDAIRVRTFTASRSMRAAS